MRRPPQPGAHSQRRPPPSLAEWQANRPHAEAELKGEVPLVRDAAEAHRIPGLWSAKPAVSVNDLCILTTGGELWLNCTIFLCTWRVYRQSYMGKQGLILDISRYFRTIEPQLATRRHVHCIFDAVGPRPAPPAQNRTRKRHRRCPMRAWATDIRLPCRPSWVVLGKMA